MQSTVNLVTLSKSLNLARNGEILEKFPKTKTHTSVNKLLF